MREDWRPGGSTLECWFHTMLVTSARLKTARSPFGCRRAWSIAEVAQAENLILDSICSWDTLRRKLVGWRDRRELDGSVVESVEVFNDVHLPEGTQCRNDTRSD